MKKTGFNEFYHIFFVGIGGISMSGLAKFMLSLGKKVSGSDINANSQTAILSNLGATIYHGHSAENLQSDVNLIVYSGAISNNNAEFVLAKKVGIKVVERSEFLGWVCELFENIVAISGTHGKTTTTALIGNILLEANLHPTIHLGGEVVDGYNNFFVGETKYFVTEACEYKKSLLYLKSNIAVVTNIEPDHMDCYSDINDLVSAFKEFANNANNVVLHNGSYDLCKNNEQQKQELFYVLDSKNKNEVNSFNKLSKDKVPKYVATNLALNNEGKYSFTVFKNGTKLADYQLGISGKYNVHNALCAIAVAEELGIEQSIVQKALKNFKGIKRRNEFMGAINGIPVYADYAHHPTEVKESIANYKQQFGNVFVVFQPHTYSRTEKLLQEFKAVFEDAYKLAMFKTYPAREPFNVFGTESVLYENILFKTKNKYLCLTKETLKKVLNQKTENSNVVLFLGAGDLYDSINEFI